MAGELTERKERMLANDLYGTTALELCHRERPRDPNFSNMRSQGGNGAGANLYGRVRFGKHQQPFSVELRSRKKGLQLGARNQPSAIHKSHCLSKVLRASHVRQWEPLHQPCSNRVG